MIIIHWTACPIKSKYKYIYIVHKYNCTKTCFVDSSKYIISINQTQIIAFYQKQSQFISKVRKPRIFFLQKITSGNYLLIINQLMSVSKSTEWISVNDAYNADKDVDDEM